MKRLQGSLKQALDTNKDSPLGMGSEFRKISTVKQIFKHHPIWPRMKSILANGSHWPLEHLDKDLQKADVNSTIEFVNHKGTSNNPVLLRELVEKDFRYGYCIPLPLQKAKLIPDLLFAPMNIQHQNTIAKTGKIIDKERLTHNQSYKWGSGTSVNSRTIKEFPMPCVYGTCLKQLINWTVATRRKYPNKRIMASKIDFKSAFQHCNLSAATAIQCCTQLSFEDLILLYLHLTFSGSPCPNKWGVFSKPICNLATAILHNDLWDPTKLHSSTQNLVLPPRTMDSNIPFGIGKELIMYIKTNPRGTHNIFIDNMIPLTVQSRNRQSSKMCTGRAPCNPCNHLAQTPK